MDFYNAQLKGYQPERIKKRRVPVGEVANTRRVERCIKLIAFLSEWRNFEQVAALLQVHPKSVFRYMNLLQNLGFVVEEKHHKRIWVRLANVKQVFNVE